MAKVTIKVTAAGFQVSGVDYHGPQCQIAVNHVTAALAARVTEEEYTAEYFETPGQEVEQ